MPLAGLTPPSQPLASHVLPGSQSSSLSQLLAALLEHVALMPQFLLWSRTRSPPWARMSSALVMASGPSLPEPVTAVTEPVVVMSPSSHAMAGHSAVGDGVGTRDGGSVGRDVGALVGTPDGASVGWDVGVDVGTVDGTPEGCQDCHVGSAVGTLVGSGDGGVVGTALGTKEK